MNRGFSIKLAKNPSRLAVWEKRRSVNSIIEPYVFLISGSSHFMEPHTGIEQ
jgi:hypothetical protein